MSANHVAANAARLKKQQTTMFPKQFSSVIGTPKRPEITAAPSDQPCVVVIECSVAFVDTFRHLIPAACEIIDCSPIDNDIKIWAFTVRVPHWPYHGRRAVAIVTEDLLSRHVELMPAVRQ